MQSQDTKFSILQKHLNADPWNSVIRTRHCVSHRAKREIGKSNEKTTYLPRGNIAPGRHSYIDNQQSACNIRAIWRILCKAWYWVLQKFIVMIRIKIDFRPGSVLDPDHSCLLRSFYLCVTDFRVNNPSLYQETLFRTRTLSFKVFVRNEIFNGACLMWFEFHLKQTWWTDLIL